MGRTKKLKDVSRINGNLQEPGSLEAALGGNGLYPYGTLDEEVYLAELKSLSLHDLHIAATKVGIKPVNSRELITKSMLSIFRKHCNSYFGTHGRTIEQKINPKDLEAIEDILRTAR